MNIPIFIINLDRCADRMQEISARLDALGLSYERFRACDGNQLQEDYLTQHYPQFLPLFHGGGPRGGLGCSISHIGLCRLLLSRGIEKACIIEDDAEFDADFPIFVDTATEYPAYAEAIKLEAGMKRRFAMCSHVGRVGGRELVYVPGNNTNGAACYIITKQGAQKVVDVVAKADYRGYDHLLFTYEQSTVKSLHVLPYPARQSGLWPSTISTDRPKSIGALKAKRRRRTIREALQIRKRRTKEVWRAFWLSRQVIGLNMFWLTMARVQSKRRG